MNKEENTIQEKEPKLDEKQKIEELTNDLKRVQAEFENFKKRFEKEKIEFLQYANAGLVEDFLPVIDSIDEALKHSAEKKGIEGIRKQLFGVMEANGVKAIECVGKKFNHELHEVLLSVCVEEEENEKILEEFQKGYLLNGKVLRHSKVKINNCDEGKENLEE
ncbi:MAG: nucleotide exchange factor GrpE [archaeon]|nr:nucleotide exchange factor GrpE [archaeon]